jgi:hypothetical protein
MTNESEGYIALAEYIKTQLESGTPIEKSLSQIKLALRFNIIPNDTFKSVLSIPFEDLYAKIQGVAKDKGYPILETEQAEVYCKSIYTALQK